MKNIAFSEKILYNNIQKELEGGICRHEYYSSG